VVIELEYTATYCSHSGAWLSYLTTPMEVSGAATHEVREGLMRILGTTSSSSCALFPARLRALRRRQQRAGSARTQSGPTSKSSVCPTRLKQVL
jgi:hypothetical protein